MKNTKAPREKIRKKHNRVHSAKNMESGMSKAIRNYTIKIKDGLLREAKKVYQVHSSTSASFGVVRRFKVETR